MRICLNANQKALFTVVSKLRRLLTVVRLLLVGICVGLQWMVACYLAKLF